MHFAAIQVDNSVRGIENRLCMIERLLAQVRDVDFVILPELSTPGYIPTPEIWDYREREGALIRNVHRLRLSRSFRRRVL